MSWLELLHVFQVPCVITLSYITYKWQTNDHILGGKYMCPYGETLSETFERREMGNICT